LKSRNGFTVNGKKKQECVLKPGDQLNIRGHPIRVYRHVSTDLSKDEETKPPTPVETEQQRSRREILKQTLEGRLAETNAAIQNIERKFEQWKHEWGIQKTPPTDEAVLCREIGIKQLDWKVYDGMQVAATYLESDDEEDGMIIDLSSKDGNKAAEKNKDAEGVESERVVKESAKESAEEGKKE